jgi:hypothetical protein
MRNKYLEITKAYAEHRGCEATRAPLDITGKPCGEFWRHPKFRKDRGPRRT